MSIILGATHHTALVNQHLAALIDQHRGTVTWSQSREMGWGAPRTVAGVIKGGQGSDTLRNHRSFV